MNSNNTSASTQAQAPATDPEGRMIVGVDLAKKVFQVCYRIPGTKKIINHQLTRAKFREFLMDPNMPRMLVAMEACGSSHYWGNFCLKYHHEPMIIPAETVHGYQLGNKDDANDARCIWQVAFMPGVKTVRVRTPDNMAMMALLRFRETLKKSKNMLVSGVRAMLYEMGKATPEGAEAVMSKLKEFIEELDREEPDSLRSEVLKLLATNACNRLKAVISSEQTIDDFITGHAGSDKDCRLLMTIPFIGPVAALAIATVMACPDNFGNGRQFADYCGFAPCHTGTGGKVAVLGLPAKGNRCLKRVLYEPAVGMYTRAKLSLPGDDDVPEALSDWIMSMSDRKPMKKVVCAIANKLCRISWAVLKSGSPYEQKKSSLIPPSVQGPDGKVRTCKYGKKSDAKKLKEAIAAAEAVAMRA